MFSQVDIGSFGSFTDLSWKNSLKDAGNNVQNFKRLNILYGRNYSGKTTLSRIFRALETGRIPHNYVDPNFTIRGDKGDVTQVGLAGHGYDVRVYNRDFVSDNLNFLVNQTDGEIKTFAIVGEKNKEIEDAITAIQTRLGSVESKAGLRHELEAKKKERDRTKDNHKTASDALEGKLRSHANNKIKQNRIYGPAVYNIESIKKDIGLVKKPGFRALTTEEQAAKVNLLKQEALPDINDTVSINLNIESISKEAEELLLRLIEPTLPIQELLNETALQMWVKEGIPLHKDKRDTCAFCRQNLPHDIWQVLGSHFSKESSALESSIDSCLTSITTEIQAIPNFLTLTGDKFYAEEKILFENSKIELSEHLKDYMQDLKALQAALNKRKNAIFQQVLMPVYIHNPTAIQQCVGDINALIVKNNDRTISLENDKSTARESLRLTDVASFIADITYDNEFARIASLKSDANTANTAFTETEAEIFEQETEVTRLQGQQKDERKGAERVNELLSHFFGHDGIELEAKDNVENTSVKFEVTRDGKSAYNLSEGECSLIAFCYFMAKLEEPESKGKDLIIYIDDPISSLDGNHIFFMFSLIESLIAKPIKNLDGTNSYRYKQLFISTHNLDFLKYLKKISLPNERNHGGCQHLIVERNGGTSQISLMPSYLRDYITEFNYLFHQIYKCRNQVGANESHEPYYGFGNNLRKFLEAFLFFKFPHHDDKNDAFERIKKFFGEEDSTAIALVNRLNNEFSHLESIPDRGFKPVEIPEISKVANYVLDKIYASDPHQYNSLLKSIGEPPRLS
ncbi:AAA family ATPase [Escherichia coli]|uniref:AAA family ATPase n=1 Tax=Escherichia coli TaxID=562 RepID=UPI001BFE27C5|nr:AAA family ATPase [Escherichia coli]MCZ0288008.1 AAA family ATPase [Escherichia coli]MCZ0352899.1 AAA family ATPase [Escherichia coli]MCZ0367690.1 AAA family ATPase [Escherichia coli]MCZ0423081.1 AAA family ATPase [Escherichia coli]MCZ0459441.1 AAA family ATPase [Escherichia coli]